MYGSSQINTVTSTPDYVVGVEAGQFVLVPAEAGGLTGPSGGPLPNGLEGASGVVTLSDGSYGLVDPEGAEYPLTFLSGTPYEPTIAGSVNQVLTFDQGSDVAHTEILWMFNVTGASEDTADEAQASAGFAAPTTNSEVTKTTITGSGAAGVYAYRFPDGLTAVHFALAGGAEYTTAAGATCTGTEMVLMQFPEVDNINTLEIRLGGSTGTNGRTRQATVTGYAG